MNLDSRKIKLFLNGVKLETKRPDGLYSIYSESKFIGIGTVCGNKLKRELAVFGDGGKKQQK